MTFKHKLSKRLALMRDAALVLPAAAIFACAPGDRTLGLNQPNFASTTSQPGTVTDLSVTAMTDTSVTLAFTEVSDGTGQPASYDIRYAVGPLSWGSAASVGRGTCATPVAGCAIGAQSICAILGLAAGTGCQFQLVAFRGTLDVNAVFGGLSNVASGITVIAQSGGGTALLQETFEDNAFASRSWYDNPSMATTDTVHIAGSTHSLEIHFTAGATAPTWGGGARRLFPPTQSVYLSYWVKYSTNWVGSGQPYHPHEFYFLTNEDAAYAGPAFTHLTTYVEHNYQNGGIPVLTMQDGSNIDQSRIGVDLTAVTDNRAAAGCNGNTDGYPTDCYLGSPGQYWNGKTWKAAQPAFLPAPGPGYKGDWHFVEAYFQLNSIQNGIGVPDGIVRHWVDGQLVIEHTNVLFRTGAHPTMMFNQLLIGPYIGSGSPVDQFMWVDNLTVATGRMASASVAAVAVGPASAGVLLGATQQFTATVLDGAGSLLTGQTIAWAASNPAVATVNGTGLVTALASGTTTVTATTGGVTGTATLTVTVPVSTKPGTVTDLSVAGVTTSGVTLAFTEVDDGTGQPASYDIRSAPGTLAWGSAASVTSGTCASPLAGSAIGAKRSCTVLGLTASTGYYFQLVAFRGTLNVNAVFGGLSNQASEIGRASW